MIVGCSWVHAAEPRIDAGAVVVCGVWREVDGARVVTAAILAQVVVAHVKIECEIISGAVSAAGDCVGTEPR